MSQRAAAAPPASLPVPASIAVVVGLDLLGDGLIKLPFLRTLRARCPGARITWATLEGPSVFGGALAPLAAGLIDELLEQAGPRSLRDFLRRPFGGRAFDLLLDTQRGLGTTLWLRRAHAQRFVSAAAGWRLSQARPRQRTRPPALADQLRALLEAGLGEGPWIGGPPELPTGFVEQAAALLPAGPRYLGLAPGAGGQRKRWPLERFLALAREAEALGFVPVLLLGPNEAELEAELRRALPAARLPLQAAVGEGHEAGPLLTLALARRLAVAVANDSGTGHLLAAGGAPLVSLFGPTEAAKFAPAGATVVRAQDHGGSAMTAIPLAAVLAAVSSRENPAAR